MSVELRKVETGEKAELKKTFNNSLHGESYLVRG
ncbi:hypothetical protein BN2127_JRS7_03377 [Bacillus subtilis]|nr:hypothetical protein BN2127_JRS1_09053 [Bacillus cereus]CUB43724.1 hypothetical protein BN2127_JRS7_03377 [Bacillus subtilis]